MGKIIRKQEIPKKSRGHIPEGRRKPLENGWAQLTAYVTSILTREDLN